MNKYFFVHFSCEIPFQRKTPRKKIDLSNKTRKVWIKKSDLNCSTSLTCFRTCATNDIGCSKHMTGDKTILMDHKKNEINSFTLKAVGDYGSKMHVTTQPDIDAEPDSHVSTPNSDVATLTEQRDIVSAEHPSKVKKNHSSELLAGSIDDLMVT